jgi:hypothetical protein
MLDEELRRLCIATVANTRDAVLRDLCQSALDLLSRNYEMRAELEHLRVDLTLERMPNLREPEPPVARKNRKKKSKLSAKQKEYRRNYMRRKREEKKAAKVAQLEALATIIEEQDDGQQPEYRAATVLSH